ncbi:reverse transcriptase domain-containing protein, partial [Pandoraea sputorum]|uniref:reverse transcriptase domain-containing protein n=1 Tax=Pandoraea sputorum TaxID=93222 RepID=UPI002F936C6A
MPMGLTNAPAECQRYAEAVIREHPSTRVYIDDFLVATKGTREEHLREARAVRQTLNRAGIETPEKKTQWATSEVRYLGMILSHERIKPSADIQAITDWPEPRGLKELQVFLGM